MSLALSAESSGRPRSDTLQSLQSVASSSSLSSDMDNSTSSPLSLTPSTPATSIFSSSSWSQKSPRIRSTSNATGTFALFDPVTEEAPAEDELNHSYFDRHSTSPSARPITPDAAESYPGTPISGTSTPAQSRNASVLAFQPIVSSASDTNLASTRSRSLLSLARPFKSRKHSTSMLSNLAGANPQSPTPGRSRSSSNASTTSRTHRAPLLQRMLNRSRQNSQADLVEAADLAVPSMPTRVTRPRAATASAGSSHATAARPSIGRRDSAPSQLIPFPLTRPPKSPLSGSNLFETRLPRELQLRVFSTLFDSIVKHQDAADRWSGYAGAVRQLIRLTRVSRQWASLALDGQLWTEIHLQNLGPWSLQRTSLLKVARIAGPFLKRLDFAGYSLFDDDALSYLAVWCCTPGTGWANLTSLNLDTCRSITDDSLIPLFLKAPLLQHVSLCGLPTITDHALAALYSTSLCLKSLAVSRSRNVSGKALPTAKHPYLRELSASGIQGFDSLVMAQLGQSFPRLTKLDISDSGQVTDQALRWFVRGINGEQEKRTTDLQHLNVSKCSQLTDSGFFELIGTMPDLQSLEAGDIGNRLRDAGLVAFCRSTPKLRKLDLEGNAELTDEFIDSLWRCPQLEHLVLSYVIHLSDAGVCRMFKQADNLRVLELDNTRVSDAVVHEFIKTMRSRRTKGAEINVVDCRPVSRHVLAGVQGFRSRRGVRGWRWQGLDYSNHPSLREFDDQRILIKSFGTWSLLDSVQGGNGVLDEPATLRSTRRSSSCTIS